MHAAVAPSQPAVLSLWVVARRGSVSDYMTGCEKGKPTTKSALTVCLVAGPVGWVGSNPHFENGANPSIVWLPV